mmetsp:Transcript_100950/g.174392  ORF Transcript_100950/g.174392 Transcript_100950/m.174392 type:complete len:99 (+) Transcript_100950:1187-1483(+)
MYQTKCRQWTKCQTTSPLQTQCPTRSLENEVSDQVKANDELSDQVALKSCTVNVELGVSTRQYVPPPPHVLLGVHMTPTQCDPSVSPNCGLTMYKGHN